MKDVGFGCSFSSTNGNLLFHLYLSHDQSPAGFTRDTTQFWYCDYCLKFLLNFQQPREHRRPRSNDMKEGKDGWMDEGSDGNQVMIRFPSYLIGLRLMVKYLSGFLKKKKCSSILKESLKGNKELETCLLVAKSV